MHSVFKVDILPQQENCFPSNLELLEWFRNFNWEPKEITLLDDENSKEKQYRGLASELLQHMPEITIAEQGHIIFYGVLKKDTMTKFFISRQVAEQLVFRLFNPRLDPLQSSTIEVVKKILQTRFGNLRFSLANQTIEVYEHGHTEIILYGRVIISPFKETLSRDRRNFLLFIGSFVISIILLTVLAMSNTQNNSFFNGALERASTATLTTSIISIGLLTS